MQILFRKNIFTEKFPPTPHDDVRAGEEPRLPFSPFKIVGVILFLILLFAAIADLNLLAPERAEKLKNLFKKIDEEAEQYALIAAESKVYPCFSCSDKDTIFLNAGETWKFGVSINGVKGRYTDKFLKDNNLLYEVQFVGNMAECYKIFKNTTFLQNKLQKLKLSDFSDTLVLMLTPSKTPIHTPAEAVFR